MPIDQTTHDQLERSAGAAWVTIDATLHAEPGMLTCLYSTDVARIGDATTIESRNGRAVHIEVPAGGFVMYG